MKTFFIIFLLTAAITLTACQNADTTPTAISPTVTPLAATATATATAAPSPSPTPVATPTSPLATVSFRAVGVIGQIESLNPLLNLNPALAKISPLLYPTLNRVEPETASPQPFAAELPTIAADNLTLTFTLRLTDITPADVQASIETAILPELEDVRAVKIVDARTVRITLTEPNCTAMDTLAQLPILPQAQVGADAPGKFIWNADSQTLVLPDTSGAGALTLHFFADAATAQSALSAGEIDAIEPPELIAPSPRLIFAPFNNLQPPFDDSAVRRALSLAVDRKSLVRNYLGGQFAPSILPEPRWGAIAQQPPFPTDPDAARNALDAVGISDHNGDGWRELPGESQPWQVTIEVDVNREDLQPIAFWLAEYYRQIGVQARAEMVPFSTLIDDLLTHDYQVAVYDWKVDVSAVRARWHSNSIDAEFGQNITGYSNPQVDALIDALDTAPHCDISARAETMRKINQLLANDRPGDFLGFSF